MPWQDANDGLQLAVEGDGFADDGWVGVEVVAPEMIAEDDDGRPVRDGLRRA